MKDKKELISMLESYLVDEEQVNHWIRRFYRCYTDGSYIGFEHYKHNLDVISKLKSNNLQSYARLRMTSLDNFTSFLSLEFGLSKPLCYKTVKSVMTINFESFVQELMDDMVNIAEKDLTDFFTIDVLKSKLN